MASAPPLDLSARSNDASLVLDAIRMVAAQAVLVGHAFIFFDVYSDTRGEHVPFMQNIGVIIFFWLSGFLIAHALVRNTARATYGFRSYLLDRVARIYSAYLPALLFIWLVDSVMLWNGRYDYATYLTPMVFIGNLFMFQMYPAPQGWRVPSLGTGGPLWTLPIEFHIYLFIGALFFLTKTQSSVGRRPLMVLAVVTAPLPLWYLFGDVQEHVGTGLFSLWMLGFAAYFVLRAGGQHVSRPLCWLIVLAALGWYGQHVEHGREYAPVQYVVLAAGLTSLVAVLLRTRFFVHVPGLSGLVQVMAGYSFSLYLLHYTILYSLWKLWTGSPAAGAWLGIALSNGIALSLAYVTEFRHKQLARWLKAKVDPAVLLPSN